MLELKGPSEIVSTGSHLTEEATWGLPPGHKVICNSAGAGTGTMGLYSSILCQAHGLLTAGTLRSDGEP